jgi:RNA polymerase sigma-70 factor (ECF subfamily)
MTTDLLAALFDEHADRLYRLARRLAPTADAALDHVQETFLRAARTPAAVPQGRGDAEAWLVRVLVNLRRDEWRKEAVRRRYDGAQFSPAAPRGNPEDVLIVRADVWRALDRLAPRRRAVVVMHELEGLSIPSIASLLGINAITVRWHLSRGRRELARQLRVLSGDIDEQPDGTLAGRRPAASRTAAS